MTTFVDEMDAVLIELLAEFGWAASLLRSSNPIVDKDTLAVSSTVTTHPVEGVFFDPTNSSLVGYEQVFNEDHLLSRKWALIRSSGIVLRTGDIISSVVYGDFVINQQTAIGPTSPIYYKCSMEKVKNG